MGDQSGLGKLRSANLPIVDNPIHIILLNIRNSYKIMGQTEKARVKFEEVIGGARIAHIYSSITHPLSIFTSKYSL